MPTFVAVIIRNTIHSATFHYHPLYDSCKHLCDFVSAFFWSGGRLVLQATVAVLDQQLPSDDSNRNLHSSDLHLNWSVPQHAVFAPTSAPSSFKMSPNLIQSDSVVDEIADSPQEMSVTSREVVPIASSVSEDPNVRVSKSTCPYCSSVFWDLSNLRRHIMTHTGERPFKCPLCSHSCNRKGNLMAHIKGRHKDYDFSGSSHCWIQCTILYVLNAYYVPILIRKCMVWQETCQCIIYWFNPNFKLFY